MLPEQEIIKMAKNHIEKYSKEYGVKLSLFEEATLKKIME